MIETNSAPVSPGRGVVEKPSFPGIAPGTADEARRTTREAYFEEADGYVETVVYERSALGAGAAFEGPAIVEQSDTTTVVYPGQRCRTDSFGNLLIETSHAE